MKLNGREIVVVPYHFYRTVRPGPFAHLEWNGLCGGCVFRTGGGCEVGQERMSGVVNCDGGIIAYADTLTDEQVAALVTARLTS